MRPHAAAPTSFARLFAWSGALIFFFALAYFLFSYAVTYGRAANGGGTPLRVTWNVALFTIFAAHHSVFARARVRRRVEGLAPGLERTVYVWVASLLFIAVCAWWQPVDGVAWDAEGALRWILLLLQGAGAWLTLRSAAIIDVRELAGLTPPAPDDDAATEFKSIGPYGWVRHPIYTGWFLIVFAASPMTMTRLVFAVVSSAYLLLAIPLEERSLLGTSGGAYERYRRRVRWKLVPGVY